MKNFYSFFFVMIAAIITTNLFSQNTFPSSGAAGIGTTSPAASSLLEVKSTSKGVLFSRMTRNQRDAITSPATGLLIYQTNATPGFYYFDGAAWQPVSSGANTSLSNLSPTKINVNLMADTNNKRNLGSPAKGWQNLYLDGAVYLGGSKFIAAPGGGGGGGNTAVGIGTLFSNTAGSQNTANGSYALYANTTGFGNTANGSYALSSNTTGGANTAIGYDALYSNTTGLYNSANGYKALYSNTTGLYNSANGFEALYSNTTGYNNSANGFEALYSNTTGEENTANGFEGLYSNTTGDENTANGTFALYSNTTGIDNTANGYKALYSSTTGSYNSANGSEALYLNTTGSENTANGSEALFSNTTGRENTANGSGALSLNTTGSENTANGWAALSWNTTGYKNTANGVSALSSNTIGVENTANGWGALYSNTTGSQNTATGNSALYYNRGNDNTANGWYALFSNTTGSENTASGLLALVSNTTGTDNTANGSYALSRNTTGNYNTATGYYALYLNTEHYNTAFGANSLSNTAASQYNTAVGYYAGGAYDNGYNNVFVGANVDVTGPGFYNVIAIGQGTVCTDVSQVTMGNGATATYRAYANWSNISDGRFKKNIKENVPGLEFINKLQPITYTLDATGIDNFLHQSQPQDKQASGQSKVWMSKALAAKEKTIFTGFVAQDVEKAAKSLNYDFSGVDAAKNDKDLYGLRYAEFVVPLVKAVQELSKQNDSLKNAYNEKFNEQQKQIDELKAMISSNPSIFNHQLATISSASLAQNVPNPFQNTTTINYSLPNQFTSAKIIVTDKRGNALKEINLPAGGKDVSGTGKGSVNIDAATLSSGAYQYSLYVNGRLIDTKQMEHIK